ncbi:hypothetical protein CHS0354_042458 [Potamilus streckersoni]|uniref:Uncharacterized protein n=1 Tax=Potamilus streckersoni TaxID=2493646 RepID=A0AAE0S9P0_9BIVA|nr:hypothetical protein CHS0354_042458 [Potamilus streckersoni]
MPALCLIVYHVGTDTVLLTFVLLTPNLKVLLLTKMHAIHKVLSKNLFCNKSYSAKSHFSLSYNDPDLDCLTPKSLGIFHNLNDNPLHDLAKAHGSELKLL